jgi:hypothetical protein
VTRFSPGSVRTAVGGGIRRYRTLQLAERVVFTAWSTAVLATLLGLVVVGTYQVAAAQTESEVCTVGAASPTYSTVNGRQYRFIETSCGKYKIQPGDGATRALEPAPDSIALTGSPSLASRYLLTFRGSGSDRTLIGALSH